MPLTPYSRVPVLAAAVPLAAAVGLATAPARADEPVRPVQYDPKAFPASSAPGWLVLAGAATTATWYSLALGPALLWPDSPGADDLRIPVAGPWMALADTGCADDEPNCSTLWVVFRAILIGIDGVGQAGGLAVMGEAVFMPTTAAETPAASRHRPRVGQGQDVQLRPVPFVAGRRGLGVGLVGRF